MPTPPAKFIVCYKTHQDPTDSDSDVEFTLKLSLKSEDQNGPEVGWKPELLHIRQWSSGSCTATWTKSNPTVPSADGLWWVTHSNVSMPQLSEFDMPPHLASTATASDPNDDDLDYDFEGVTCSSTSPWPISVALDYELTLDGAQNPLASGEDEPVELGENDDPPE